MEDSIQKTIDDFKTKFNKKEYLRKYHKNYYQIHKEEIIKGVINWQKNNKNRVNQNRQKYVEKNKEKLAEYQKKYHQDNKDLLNARLKNYRASQKGKLKIKTYLKSTKRIEKEKRYKQSDKGKQTQKHSTEKYSKSFKGRVMIKRRNARRRQYDFIPIYENIIEGEIIVGHHITDTHTAYIPKDLHELYIGINKDEHRFMCNQIVKQLYYPT